MSRLHFLEVFKNVWQCVWNAVLIFITYVNCSNQKSDIRSNKSICDIIEQKYTPKNTKCFEIYLVLLNVGATHSISVIL